MRNTINRVSTDYTADQRPDSSMLCIDESGRITNYYYYESTVLRIYVSRCEPCTDHVS